MLYLPEKCLRNLTDCEPLAQIESDEEPYSFICCGLNHQDSRELEQDKFRHCWKNEVIDECSDWDERDIIDTISVMSQALSVIKNRES